jgi:hypothetical protein
MTNYNVLIDRRIVPTCFYPWPLFSLAALMSCTSVCTPERKILQVLSVLDSFDFPNLKETALVLHKRRPTAIAHSGLWIIPTNHRIHNRYHVKVARGKTKNADPEHIRGHVRIGTDPYPDAIRKNSNQSWKRFYT